MLLLHPSQADPNLPGGERGCPPAVEAARNGDLDLLVLLTVCGARLDDDQLPPTDMSHSPEVREWCELAAGKTQLEMAAMARITPVISTLLCQGRLAHPRPGKESRSLLACTLTASPSPLSFPPDKNTSMLIRRVLAPWEPATHRLFGPKFRAIVHTMLVVRVVIRTRDPPGDNPDAAALWKGAGSMPLSVWYRAISFLSSCDFAPDAVQSG